MKTFPRCPWTSLYRFLLPSLVAAVSLLVAGCASAAGTGMRAWIDVPVDGAYIPIGETVQVRSHAFAGAGVAEVMLTVNGAPYRRDPPAEPGATFSESVQAWQPEQPGEYLLEVVVYDAGGAASGPAGVRVHVIPLPAVTPTSVPTETPTATDTPTPTATPVAPVQVTFWADRTSLAQGGCTDLRWTAQNAASASLDGRAVPLDGSERVCPASTTTYRLMVNGPGGEVERSVTVTVAAPVDTSPPSLGSPWHTPPTIWDGASCGPTTATVSVQASDASGIARVQLHYRVVKTGQEGGWRTVSMTAAGGNAYSASLGPSELSASLALYGGGTVEYYVTAEDGQGNTAQSGVVQFTAQLCFG